MTDERIPQLVANYGCSNGLWKAYSIKTGKYEVVECIPMLLSERQKMEEAEIDNLLTFFF
jgi:hypothetical protein